MQNARLLWGVSMKLIDLVFLWIWIVTLFALDSAPSGLRPKAKMRRFFEEGRPTSTFKRALITGLADLSLDFEPFEGGGPITSTQSIIRRVFRPGAVFENSWGLRQAWFVSDCSPRVRRRSRPSRAYIAVCRKAASGTCTIRQVGIGPGREVDRPSSGRGRSRTLPAPEPLRISPSSP